MEPPMTQGTQAVHRSILCVDVENFGDRRRTDVDQTLVRAGLYQALEGALVAAQVRWEHCHCEDRGDGFLVLIPPEVAKSNLVTIFPHELAAALERHNEAHGPTAQIRLRVALHAGEVRHDAHGVVGHPIILAFRLLDAGAVKAALRESVGALALVASDWFFDEVIRHEPAAGSEAYERVEIAVKETRTQAWVSLPDQRGTGARARDAGGVGGGVGGGPRQLPSAVPGFVGREAELSALTGLVDEPSERRAAVVIAVIAGPAGAGKTALVVHWAHRVRNHFPDGELYLNLRGDDPGPCVRPEEALDWMLRALDVDAEKIPAGVEAKAALYRSLLTGRRVLVVLDNAAGAQQVRPLVPGTPGCVVVVTSRSRLSGLTVREGARSVRLDRLAEDEAVTLLAQIIGAVQINAEPEAAATIARRCDRLPLALRVAAERAAAHPHRSLADVAEELSGEQHRLDVLDTEDDDYTGVRTAFSWSYRALPAPAARAFRLLGLHRGQDIGLDAVAALTGTTPAEARRTLGLLTGKHLVEESGRDRFRLHDLLRCYAEERARAEETGQDRSAAVRRMLVWYLHTVDDARLNLLPHHFNVELTVADGPDMRGTFTAYEDARRWCETERVNLIAAIHHAAGAGHHDIAWRLTVALTAFFFVSKYRADWAAAHQVGLAAARRLGDRVGAANVLMGLGFAFQDHRFAESTDYYRRSLDIFAETGDRPGQGWAILGVGHATRGLRRFEESIVHYHEAHGIFREIGLRPGQSLAHLGLGYAYGGLRQYDRAVDRFQRSLEFAGDDQRTEAWALHGLGYGYRALGRTEESIAHYERALVIFARIGDWWGQGEALYNLGKAQADAGRPDLARRSWTEALAIFHDLHIDRESEVRARLDTCVAVSL
jgi:tetratricopeptide (TPR) repeat protein